MENSVFKLFPSCILVAGISRSLIIDGQRWKYYTIPKPMFELLKTYDGCSIQEVLQKEGTSPEAQNILAEYFDFLFEHELIFECSREMSQQFFPVINDFNHPSIITNAIINIEKFIAADIETILLQLTDLRCYTLEIRITKPIGLNILNQLLELCSTFEIENLFLLIQLDTEIKNPELYKESFPFLNQIINYNHGSESREAVGIIYTSKDLSQNNSCGLIDAEFFTPTLKHYVESINHNTCLNRKIAIDAAGNIKNCPSLKESFGNISDTTLLEAINKPGFKKFWNITKDQISKCQDCEFRHVCTDCRAYVEEPLDDYSAPLKCGYNPYTTEWEDWSNNPLKQSAIDYYGMRNHI